MCMYKQPLAQSCHHALKFALWTLFLWLKAIDSLKPTTCVGRSKSGRKVSHFSQRDHSLEVTCDFGSLHFHLDNVRYFKASFFSQGQSCRTFPLTSSGAEGTQQISMKFIKLDFKKQKTYSCCPKLIIFGQFSHLAALLSLLTWGLAGCTGTKSTSVTSKVY